MNNCICRGLFYQFKARILQIRRHGFARYIPLIRE